ncbi:calcium-binding tyrosine phosphorylation-regulated protein isoform X1 [Arapaima gigas]
MSAGLKPASRKGSSRGKFQSSAAYQPVISYFVECGTQTDMAEVLQYPPRVVVPPGLRTVLLGLGRAVVNRQPDSIPKFSALYFTELLQFRAENPNVEISELVREFRVPRAKRPNAQSVQKAAKDVDKTHTPGPDAADKSPSSRSLDDYENTDSIASSRKTRFLSFRNLMKREKVNDKSPSSRSLDDYENTDSIASSRKTRFLSFRNLMKREKVNGETE